MFNCRLLLLALMLLNVTAVFASQNNRFEKAVAELGNSDDMVGLAVAVVRDGEVSFMKTYGVRELGSEAKVNLETRFRIASLSKAFAATVAVQLEDEKKLALSDLAISTNPSFKLKNQDQAKSATLEHALSHRLSLPPYAYDNLLEAGRSPNNILNEMKKVQPICSVGSCYAYQNVGFNMVASAIAEADKKSYESSVSNRLFEPLEMNGASFGKAKLIGDGNWARSYKRKRGKPWKAVTVKQPYYDVPAAGGVNANILDMSKWLSAQMGHSPNVLSASMLNQLQTPLVNSPRESRRVRYMEKISNTHYALGWRIYQYAGTKVVNHSGSVEGYAAQIAFLPEKKVGLIMLTNSKTKQFWRILPEFLNHELAISENQ